LDRVRNSLKQRRSSGLVDQQIGSSRLIAHQMGSTKLFDRPSLAELGKVDEKKELVEEYELPPDLYSILFVHGFHFTRASTFAMVTICQQFSIVGLFYYDLLKGGSSKNILNLPIGTSASVRAAQFLALPLAVVIHENCTAALHMLRIPYDPQILNESKLATLRSWYAAILLRFLAGFLLVLVSFIQIMQAETITDLFLNLEAIVFVGKLDLAAYWLAKSGFFKKELVSACNVLEDIRFRLPYEGHQGRTRSRRILLVSVWIMLVAGWSIVFYKHASGRYLRNEACHMFTVEFGAHTVYIDGTKIKDDNRAMPLQDLDLQSYNMTKGDTKYDPYYDASKVQLQPIRNYDGFWKNKTTLDFTYALFSGAYQMGHLPNGDLDLINKRPVYYEDDPQHDSQHKRHSTLGRFLYCGGHCTTQ
jgi:hypothetical protein